MKSIMNKQLKNVLAQLPEAMTGVRDDKLTDVELVANYLTNNPEASCIIKNSAPAEDNQEMLTNDIAEYVKELLVNKYGIAEDRIEIVLDELRDQTSIEDEIRTSICEIIVK